jgi:serine/threonine protein kinase
MQYLGDNTLFKVLKEKRFFADKNNNNKKKVILQLIDAISYIHQNELAHRKISTKNIYLDENQNIILGDFGNPLDFNENLYKIFMRFNTKSNEKERIGNQKVVLIFVFFLALIFFLFINENINLFRF